MNRIFFADKGHTRRAGIQNLWPAKYITQVLVEFFDCPGLTMHINPRLKNSEYFDCEFHIYNNSGTKYRESPTGYRYMWFDTVLAGTYGKGTLSLHIHKGDFKNLTQEQRSISLDMKQDALALLYQGIAEFEQYFTRP